MTTAACAELEPLVGISRSCQLTGRSRATRYRRQAGPLHGPPRPRPTPPNALSDAERAEVLTVLRSAKYRDLAVAQVWALLLDDGTYLCSRSTMHRILRPWRPSSVAEGIGASKRSTPGGGLSAKLMATGTVESRRTLTSRSLRSGQF